MFEICCGKIQILLCLDEILQIYETDAVVTCE
jgi:hypothetical protein